FFFQAEDGIRDRTVTGVQTCALPISARREGFSPGSVIFLDVEEGGRLPGTYFTYLKLWASKLSSLGFRAGIYCSSTPIDEGQGQIGRASCRERGYNSGVTVSFK